MTGAQSLRVTRGYVLLATGLEPARWAPTSQGITISPHTLAAAGFCASFTQCYPRDSNTLLYNRTTVKLEPQHIRP